jgi:hypothetical protein
MSTALTPPPELVETGQDVPDRISMRSRALHSPTLVTGGTAL